MAILIAMVSNAVGGKSKPADFILTKGKKQQPVSKDSIQVDGFIPIKKEDLHKFLR